MTNFLMPTINILASEFLVERIQVRFPSPKVKKYKQRTARRFARNPKNWETPRYMIDGGRTLLCHPSDVPKLRQMLIDRGLMQ